MPTDPSLANLNAKYMRAEREKMCSAGLGSHDDLLAHGLSAAVIVNAFGLEFFEREHGSAFGRSPTFIGQNLQVQWSRLGRMAWQARQIEGFEQWVERARTRDFEAAFYELYWLTTLAREFKEVKLNPEVGKRGEDFDIVGREGFGQEQLAVEVKTRSATFGRTKQLKDFLNKARDQLPAGRPGAVVFRLPVGGVPIAEQDFIETIRKVVRSSGRLAFVGYMFEVPQNLSGGGFALAMAHRWIYADGPRPSPVAFSQPNIVDSDSLIRLYCDEL